MSRHIMLDDLEAMAPGIHESHAALMKASCTAALLMHNHVSNVTMPTVFPDEECMVTVRWTGGVTKDDLYKFSDRSKRIDFAAQAIALLIVPEMTQYNAIYQSATGDGIDYYLARDGSDPDLIFNDTARLEISGIDVESPSNTIQKRVNEKTNRLKRIAAGGPTIPEDTRTFICVVEFSRPQVRAVLI